MARLLGLLLCICMLLAVNNATATETLNTVSSAPPGYTAFDQSDANLEIYRTALGHTAITLDQPNIVVDEQMMGWERYNSFSLPGEPYVWEDGSPAVPHVTRFYRIPNTGSVDLVITAAEYSVLEDVNPFPAMEEAGAFGEITKNPAVYSRNGWYPANAIEVSEPAIMRDFRVVTVTMHPVQVNPVTRQARVYSRLSADLVANDRPGINELNSERPIPLSWIEMYRSQIANLDESDLMNISYVPGTYLIITKNTTNAKPWADSVFEWRTRRGYKAVIESSSTWDANTVFATIQSKYLISDPPLEWVCLVGDPNYGGGADGIPIYSTTELDHKYGCVDGTDQVEDVAVGRLCGENLMQMAVINAKIMQYEREPYMADTMWYHKSFLYAGVCHEVASNLPLMNWVARAFRTYTGVTNNAVDYHTDTPVNEQTIRNHINGGVAFFIWRGCWIGGMSSSLAGSTSPNRRLPITFTVTCSTGDFQNANEPAESWLQAGTSPTDLKGGVCAIGTATAGTHPPENYTLCGGLMYNVINLHVEHLGTCLVGSKWWLHKAFGLNSTQATNFSRYCNLQGDPGLSIWTDVPELILATHPATLNVGTRQVSVQVVRAVDNAPVEDALVCLWKRGDDSTWVKGYTDAQGQITLPVNVRAIGEMLLTITKRNHHPYLATLPCFTSPLMCMFSAYTVDDDNSFGTSGNSDGVVNPGETIDLAVAVKNSGTTAPATNISARLTSTTPHVQVITANATYPNLAAGDSALGSIPFRIQISPSVPNREPLRLNLAVNTTLGQTNGTIELIPCASSVEYGSYTIIGSALNPGTTSSLTVTIRNMGCMAMNDVAGRIVSLSPFVQASDAQGTFGNIAIGAAVSNTSDQFIISAHAQTYRGHQVPMLLILTSTGNRIDTVQFIIPVGTALTSDPAGPDAYGYYAYDNSDVSYSELVPTYNYVNISASGMGTNLNINDEGEMKLPTQVWCTVRKLPFSFKYYGQVYDTVTIGSDGWLAFGNQPNVPLFRNYPIPAMVAPDAMIAPYWDDLKTFGTGYGVWMYNDTLNHRLIFQWKAGVGSSYSTNLDFEVILLDTTYHPTDDGNGKIIMQYNVVSMNLSAGSGGSDASGSSIGIQAPRGVIGLPYVYQNTYSPGAATVQSGRAILFTTEHRVLTGTIIGWVRDAATDSSMSDVCISAEGVVTNYTATTDSAGCFMLDDVLIGAYSLSAFFPRYNNVIMNDIVVELDSTDTIDIAMTHPEIALSTDEIAVIVDSVMLDTSFSIINNGNGPLEYEITVFCPGDTNPNPWDLVRSIPVSQLTGDVHIWGCEFVEHNWWITGGNGPGGQNLIYRFARNDAQLPPLPQPTTSAFGWRDIAYDGHLVYGSDSDYLIGIDLYGVVQDTILSPVNPARAIAYDPETDHFWVSDYTQDYFEIDRDGNIIQQIENYGPRELIIAGLAWNPEDEDGYNLYVFSQNGQNTQTRLSRLNTTHPSHLLETVIDLSGQNGDQAAGCAITGAWNSTMLVFAGIFQNIAGDRLQIHEISFNTTWISITPMFAEVGGGSEQSIALRLDPSTLLNGTYLADLHIASQLLDTMLVLPVSFTVTGRFDAVEQPVETALPNTYTLHQNYPNPFNPTTVIRYELPIDGLTRLTVYDLLGKKVTELVNERQTAGSYTVSFNASALPSGMYFYRLESGSFIRTAKMVLMK